jgi:Zn-dependent protease
MKELQNRFSAPANRVFAEVQSEVQRLNHSRIEPEHVMLILMREETGAAFQTLQEMDVDLNELEIMLLQSLKEIEFPDEELSMSEETKRILGLSMDAVATLERPYLGTEHLLMALMRDLSNRVYPIMRRIGVTYTGLLKSIRDTPHEPMNEQVLKSRTGESLSEAGIPLTGIEILKKISPVFWLLLSATIFAALAAYENWIDPGIAVFLFVTLGWIVSVSLHEFGHALVAYFGGDRGVLQRGYLTLNPLKYTHGLLSIVLPVLFLALGGIGLPGGAVYINMAEIRSRQVRSSLSAAGPAITGLLTLLLAFPFATDWYLHSASQHTTFWAGLSFLVFVQIWALVINLLPLPGLDGFGIFRPYLPTDIAQKLNRIGGMTFFILIILFVWDTPVARLFWQFIGRILVSLGVSFDFLSLGIELYRFW